MNVSELEADTLNKELVEQWFTNSISKKQWSAVNATCFFWDLVTPDGPQIDQVSFAKHEGFGSLGAANRIGNNPLIYGIIG